jgi:hypothetical protein
VDEQSLPQPPLLGHSFVPWWRDSQGEVEGIILLSRNDPDVIEDYVYCTLEDMDNKALIDQFPPYEEQAFLHIYYWKPWQVV